MVQEQFDSLLVIDTNVIISLIQAGELSLLKQIKGYKVVTPDEVIKEVTNADQAAVLSQALVDGFIVREAVTGVAELESFADFIGQMGRGEAACLAIAVHRDCLLVSDEKRRFRRLALAAIGTTRLITLESLRKLAGQ